MEAYSRDSALLLDMIRYAEAAMAVVEGLTYEEYVADQTRVLALERAIEIVGEAARHIRKKTKDRIAGVPWKEIHGQRNVLAHLYGRIDQFQLYRTATEDAPRLIGDLRKVLK
jgi:uncharacterized protein with HEPN domain